VIAVDVFEVALRPVVHVGQPALMQALFPYVHCSTDSI
jgi:hypothetical protein